MNESSQHPKLQAFLAHAGIASRRKSEELIREGKVRVNGQIAHIGERINPEKDEVLVSGKRISQKEQPLTFLIYKPAGLISTTSDELGRKTVVDFLRQEIKKSKLALDLPRLYPVGRLDQDTEGLMLLTNDGALAQKMTHPSFEVEKTYHATVLGFPTEKALAHLEKGVMLREGLTAPAKVEVLDNDASTTTLALTIHEGRNHQVKRMMLRVGYEVVKLVRVRMGEHTLEDLGEKTFVQVKP
jgi:23S rRNA pseudouridine2605 synthase